MYHLSHLCIAFKTVRPSLTSTIATESAVHDQQPQQVVLHRLPGHALVLATHSEFFRTALSKRWRKEAQGKVTRLMLASNSNSDEHLVYTTRRSSIRARRTHTTGARTTCFTIDKKRRRLIPSRFYLAAGDTLQWP